jgi:hypothetical protein
VGETDQLDPLIDESGFKDTICVICDEMLENLRHEDVGCEACGSC